MPYELVQQYWLAWVMMLSPRALTTTSESANSRRAATDNGESARPMERACTMSSSVTSTHLPHAPNYRAFAPRLKLGRRWSRWRPDQLSLHSHLSASDQ